MRGGPTPAVCAIAASLGRNLSSIVSVAVVRIEVDTGVVVVVRPVVQFAVIEIADIVFVLFLVSFALAARGLLGENVADVDLHELQTLLAQLLAFALSQIGHVVLELEPELGQQLLVLALRTVPVAVRNQVELRRQAFGVVAQVAVVAEQYPLRIRVEPAFLTRRVIVHALVHFAVLFGLCLAGSSGSLRRKEKAEISISNIG